MQIKGNKIIWNAEDFLAGLAPRYVNNAPAVQTGNQLARASSFDPFLFPGYATPGQLPVDATNVSVVTGGIRNCALGTEASVNYAYLIGDNALLHRFVISTTTVSNAGSWPHTIVVTGAITGNDCIAYNVNIAGTRTLCILYSFNDAGGSWNVGLFNTASGAFDDDWMSTIPATPLSPSGNNKPHPLKVGDDDILYIGDGNVWHALDGATGANGTFSSSVLTLPGGYITTTFARTSTPSKGLMGFAYYSPSGNSVAINASSSGPAKAFLWNYLDLDPSDIYDLNDSAVDGGFEYKGTVGCFTLGNTLIAPDGTSYSRLQLFNGSSFDVLTEYSSRGNTAYLPINGGVEIVGESIQWNINSIVYSFGSPYHGLNSGLNALKLGTSLSVSGGMLRTVGGKTGCQLISSGTGTGGGLQYFSNTVPAYNSGSFATAIAYPMFEAEKMGKVKSVKVNFAQTAPIGRSVAVSIQNESLTTTKIVDGIDTITSSNISKRYEKSTTDGDLPRFVGLRLTGGWGTGSTSDTSNAPNIRDVEVEFESVNIEES